MCLTDGFLFYVFVDTCTGLVLGTTFKIWISGVGKNYWKDTDKIF